MKSGVQTWVNYIPYRGKIENELGRLEWDGF